MKTNDVFVTSDEAYMRGHDYKMDDSNKEGIALFLQKPFSCKRTFLQALGRVGRYGEPCKRYVKKDLEIINSEEFARSKLCISNKIQLALEQEATRKRDLKAAANNAKRQTRAAAKQ